MSEEKKVTEENKEIQKTAETSQADKKEEITEQTDIDQYKKHPKVKCPICGAEVHPRSLKRHLELLHGIKDTKAEKPEVIVKPAVVEEQKNTEVQEIELSEKSFTDKLKEFFSKWKIAISVIIILIALGIALALRKKVKKNESNNK